MITLYNRNCLDVLDKLEKNSIDILFTDPPYGIKYSKIALDGYIAGRNTRPKEWYDFKNDKNLNWFEDFIKKVKPLLKENGKIFWFADQRSIWKSKSLLDNIFPFKRILVWTKNSGQLGFFIFSERVEYILYHTKKLEYKTKVKLRTNKEQPKTNIFYCKLVEGMFRDHPCQKPYKLIYDILNPIVTEEQTVLDPFMGTGVIGKVCKDINVNYIGIEIDKNYFEIANKKIKGS